ncbi:hypothetical protein [Thiorhodococcus mannitoliphagus]|nr:hypothetical protein [Thiorhodococcus mannitoliphagus]
MSRVLEPGVLGASAAMMVPWDRHGCLMLSKPLQSVSAALGSCF